MLGAAIRRGLRRRLPILTWLPRYSRKQLRRDLIAGAIVVALAVPQSLGYAAIAGVPVQVGLYAVPIALAAYAVFGTSPQLIVGPVSTVSVLSGTLVVTLGPRDVNEAMTYTSAIALAAGVVLVIAGLLRIGWIAEFLSKPIVTGFVFGLTLLVIIGELPNLLGIRVPMGDVGDRIVSLVRGLDQVDLLTATLSAAALAVLFLGPLLSRAVPWSLVVLVGGLVASRVFHLADRGVAVVGHVPGGPPTPSIPFVPATKLVDVALAGAAIALVGLAEALSAARLFAVKHGYRLDTDQELVANGAANIGSSIVGGLGVAGSLSKTAAVDRAGGTSQVSALGGAALAIAAILLAAPALSVLPKAVLSAIVVHAVWGLMDVRAIRRYMRIRLNDGIGAIVAALGVLIAGPLLGLGIAVGQSLLGLVYRSSRVDVEILGKIPGEKAAWGGIRQHPERTLVHGILVLRVDIALFWVNATEVQDAILENVDAAEGIKALILDLESTDQLDTTSADMLASLHKQLNERNVDLYLVHVRWPVRTVLRHHGLRAELGEDHIWHSISQGIREARRQHQIPSAEPHVAEVASTEEDVVVATPTDGQDIGRRFGRGSAEPEPADVEAEEEIVVAPRYEELPDDEPLDGRGRRRGADDGNQLGVRSGARSPDRGRRSTGR
jgi:sulfate permease, SulP family